MREIIIKYQGDICPLNQKFLNRNYVLTKRYRTTKEAISWQFKSQMLGYKPLSGSVEVTLYTYYPRKHDIDCFIKSILDAGSGILYKDDDQIVKITIVKNKYKTSGFHLKIKPSKKRFFLF